MSKRIAALFAGLAFLVTLERANADEVKPKSPDELILNFRNGPALWTLKLGATGGAKQFQIFCDGKLMMTPKLPKDSGWKIKGNVIGAELVDYSRTCSRQTEVNLYVRDLTAAGDKTVVRYNLSVDGDEVFVFQVSPVG